MAITEALECPSECPRQPEKVEHSEQVAQQRSERDSSTLLTQGLAGRCKDSGFYSSEMRDYYEI